MTGMRFWITRAPPNTPARDSDHADRLVDVLLEVRVEDVLQQARVAVVVLGDNDHERIGPAHLLRELGVLRRLRRHRLRGSPASATSISSVLIPERFSICARINSAGMLAHAPLTRRPENRGMKESALPVHSSSSGSLCEAHPAPEQLLRARDSSRESSRGQRGRSAPDRGARTVSGVRRDGRRSSETLVLTAVSTVNLRASGPRRRRSKRLLRAAHARAGAAGGGDARALAWDSGRALAAADPLLRDALPDQLRHRRVRHRTGPGVRVRDELVRLLEVRRKRVRRAVGDRGPGRVHARVDVPRPVDLRLEPAPPAGASRDALDRGAGLRGPRATSSSSRT